ncbi:MAG: hypothetical protein ACIARR_10700 [Phycisphaerales bacterium JB059]
MGESTSTQDIPRWLPESATTLPARVWRCVTLAPRLWRPWRVWSALTAHVPVSWSALLGFLLVVLGMRLLMGVAGAADAIAFTISPPPSGAPGADAAELAREIASPQFSNLRRQDGAIDPTWLGAPLAAHTAFLLMLLALSSDRKRVGVTSPHVVRAWVYGLVWLGAVFLLGAVAGLLDAVALGAWEYSDLTREPGVLESVSAGLVRATESPVVLALVGLWILLWWRSAIVRAWKIPRGQAGWVLLSVVALVAGTGALLLTRHFQILRDIAAG